MFYFSLLINTFGHLLHNIVILLSNSGSVGVPTPTFTGQETRYILNRLQVKKKEKKEKKQTKFDQFQHLMSYFLRRSFRMIFKSLLSYLLVQTLFEKHDCIFANHYKHLWNYSYLVMI